MKHFTLNLNMKLLPMHRESIENILDSVLRKVKIGKVDGGGTLFMPNNEILNCDIELAIKKHDENTLMKIVAVIEEIGVAKGSKLIGKKLDFSLGNLEGMALYLNGTELDKEVYKTCHIDHVIEEAHNQMGDKLKIFSYWEGATETALYFYGTSFSEMKKSIENLVASYPLCEKARIIQIV